MRNYLLSFTVKDISLTWFIGLVTVLLLLTTFLPVGWGRFAFVAFFLFQKRPLAKSSEETPYNCESNVDIRNNFSPRNDSNTGDILLILIEVHYFKCESHNLVLNKWQKLKLEDCFSNG